jgi:hypothetical protein
MSLVLYGCETWSLTRRAEYRLRVCVENRVLREIFGTTREEVTGDWRRLLDEDLHESHCSPNVIRVIKLSRMRWMRHVARMGQKSNAYRVLVGKPDRKRPLARPRRK